MRVQSALPAGPSLVLLSICSQLRRTACHQVEAIRSRSLDICHAASSGAGTLRCDRREVVTTLPGCLFRWEANSYGYYGADGKKLHATPEAGEAYGPNFRAGDVVGAGLHIQRQEIFFT